MDRRPVDAPYAGLAVKIQSLMFLSKQNGRGVRDRLVPDHATAQTSPVTTATKETKRTAAAAKSTVSAVSAHSLADEVSTAASAG